MNREQTQPEQLDMDEVLTSYLDDELTPEEREEVETRLGRDSDFRGRLNQLQRAWDMLDELPKTELTFDFTKSTVEMVATKAAEETESTGSGKSRWGLILGMGGALLAAVAGYLIVYAALDSPNRRLMSDLPVLEKLDEYRFAEDIEFLEMLDQEGLFDDAEEAVDESM